MTVTDSVPDKVTDWLLEESNPSVRYFALTRLKGLSERHRDVKRARQAIMEVGVVPKLLALQQPGGFWGRADRFYHDKYRGTVWQLLVLAEHGASPDDPRVIQACEFILEKSQDRSTGGFAMNEAVRTGGGRPREVIPCLTGNMVWSLLRLGYAGDPRVQDGIEWLAKYVRIDDGKSTPPPGFAYSHWEMCYGRHACFMGVVKGLKALAEVPVALRSPAVRRSIRNGAEFMLQHHVFKRSHDLRRVAKPGWRRFSFPLMWCSDVLEVLLVLTQLGIRDQRMQEAIDLVVSKQDDDGRWRLDETVNDRVLVRIESRGQASKWVTLHALTVLGRWQELARGAATKRRARTDRHRAN